MKLGFAAFGRTARPAAILAATGLQCWIALAVVLAALLAASPAAAQLELFVATQKGEAKGKDSIVVFRVDGVDNLTSLTLLRTLAKPDGPVVDLTGLATPSAVAVVQDKLFVANRSGGSSKTGSITVYGRTAQGNASPEATLEGPDFDLPSGLAVTETELFVANQSVVSQSQANRAPSITVYRWSLNGDGKVVFNPTTPVRSIKGVSTGLEGPGFLALDRVNDELFVSNNYNGTVTVHKRSDAGDQRYRRRILAVGATGLTFATGVAVDPAHDELFLAYGFGLGTGTISVWTRTAADDPPPIPLPIRTLQGPATQVDSDAPNGLALDVVNNRFFAADRGTNNFPGSITVHALTWNPNAFPFANQPPLHRHPDENGEIFSPVALALVDTGNSFDFELTVSPQQITVPPGSTVSITVTARLLNGGAGRVTFREPFADPGAIAPAGTVVPAFCDFSGPPATCTRTLRIVAGSTRGTFPIVVRATGAPTNCGLGNRTSMDAGICDVVRETPVTLTVDPGVPPLGFLHVLKTGNGRCAVTSVPAGLTCGLDQVDCSASFPVPPTATTTVTLTAAPDANSSLTGWSSQNCTPQQSCPVTITSGNTTTVGVVCDLVQTQVSLTVVKAGNGRGTVTSVPAGISCGVTCSQATGTFNSVIAIVLTAAAEQPGSTFAGWTGCPSPNGATCTVGPTTTQTTVTATFNAIAPATAQLSVVNLQLGGRGTVTSDLPGVSCEPVCAGTFNVGTSVTLRPTPGVNPPGVNPVGANSVFVGWGSPCAGFDSVGQPHVQCTVPVPANGASVDAWFVATLQQAFVARLYLNVLPGIRPTLQNVNDLVTSVAVSPQLSVQALVDAFFDGPNRPKRPALSAADYVRVVVRALLWREPTQSDLDLGAQFLSATTSSPDDQQLVAERQLRGAVIEGSEFKALIGSVFGTSGF